MKQVPACTRSLRCLAAASSPARGEEQEAAGEAKGPGAFGICPSGVLSYPPCPPGAGAPEGSALEGCKFVFFMVFIRGRRGRWHHAEGGQEVAPWGLLRTWSINPGETQLCAKGWQWELLHAARGGRTSATRVGTMVGDHD